MIIKARKKPIEIEAMLYTGTEESRLEVAKWATRYGVTTEYDGDFYIDTLEGSMHASEGDYIIKGVKGEFYSCKPDIFEMSYDIVSYKYTVSDEN